MTTMVLADIMPRLNWLSASTLALAPAIAVLAVWFGIRNLRRYIEIMIHVLDDHSPDPDSGGERIDPAGETVHFRAADGHLLRGMMLESSPGARGLVIFGHEFCSDLTSCVRYCDPLREAGYDVFAFDFRGHGGSDPQPGYRPRWLPTDRERSDMHGAIGFAERWLCERGRPADIGLFGVSRGGGAAILAAEHHPSVKAIVTDGAFSGDATLEYLMRRFATIFARIRVVAENHPRWFWRFLRWLFFRECERRFRCRFPSVRRAVGRLGRRPILIVHGEKDSYIPIAQSQSLFDLARGPKQLWIVPSAKHNQAILLQPGEYARRAVRFFDEHLATRVAHVTETPSSIGRFSTADRTSTPSHHAVPTPAAALAMALDSGSAFPLLADAPVPPGSR